MAFAVDPLVGRRLAGRYRIVRPLRAGGMGAVYEAVQEDLGRPVAVKVLTAEIDRHALGRFRQEAEAAARLGHPHIVGVTDFQANEDEPAFLVMELLAGESLADILYREGRLHWVRAARVALQVLAALSAAHAAKIVHRDIKPANIFIVSSAAMPDMVKVLDFGIAKLLDPTQGTPMTQAGSILGTLAYMSPEQARGDHVDGRSDLYAVGVCLYEAIVGRRPVEADDARVLRAAIASGAVTPIDRHLPDVEPTLRQILGRALQPLPSLRYGSAQEMGAALAGCVASGAAGSSGPPRGFEAPVAFSPHAATGSGIAGALPATVPLGVPPTRAMTSHLPPGFAAQRSMPPPRRLSPLVITSIVGFVAIAVYAVIQAKVFYDDYRAVGVVPTAVAKPTPTATTNAGPLTAGRPAWWDDWERGLRRTDWQIVEVAFSGLDQKSNTPSARYEIRRGNLDGAVVLFEMGSTFAATAGAKIEVPKYTAVAVDGTGMAQVSVPKDAAAARTLMEQIRPRR